MRGKYAVHDPQFMHGSPNRMQSGGTAEKVVIDLTDGYSLLNTGLYSTDLTTYSNSMKRRFALPGADEGDQPDDYLTRSERPRKKGWSSRDQLQSQVSAPASAQQQLLQSRVKQPGANCKQPHPTITMAQAHNIYKQSQTRSQYDLGWQEPLGRNASVPAELVNAIYKPASSKTNQSTPVCSDPRTSIDTRNNPATLAGLIPHGADYTPMSKAEGKRKAVESQDDDEDDGSGKKRKNSSGGNFDSEVTLSKADKTFDAMRGPIGMRRALEKDKHFTLKSGTSIGQRKYQLPAKPAQVKGGMPRYRDQYASPILADQYVGPNDLSQPSTSGHWESALLELTTFVSGSLPITSPYRRRDASVTKRLSHGDAAIGARSSMVNYPYPIAESSSEGHKAASKPLHYHGRGYRSSTAQGMGKMFDEQSPRLPDTYRSHLENDDVFSTVTNNIYRPSAHHGNYTTSRPSPSEDSIPSPAMRSDKNHDDIIGGQEPGLSLTEDPVDNSCLNLMYEGNDHYEIDDLYPVQLIDLH